jgi:hypothetical protein
VRRKPTNWNETLRSKAEELIETGRFPTDPDDPAPPPGANEDEIAAENALKAYMGGLPWPQPIHDPLRGPDEPPVIIHNTHEAELFAEQHNMTLADLLNIPSAADVGRANHKAEILVGSPDVRGGRDVEQIREGHVVLLGEKLCLVRRRATQHDPRGSAQHPFRRGRRASQRVFQLYDDEPRVVPRFNEPGRVVEGEAIRKGIATSSTGFRYLVHPPEMLAEGTGVVAQRPRPCFVARSSHRGL